MRGNGPVTPIDYSMPSKTDQSFKREVDVNRIMDRARKGGVITHLRRSQGVYADISKVPDLAGAFSLVESVSSAFADLPSELRDAMRNDPRNLPAFMEDARNFETLVKYGIIEKPKEGSPEATSGESAKAPAPKATRGSQAPKKPEVPAPEE